jgi:DNA-binding CsgD family transcriptional regulator
MPSPEHRAARWLGIVSDLLQQPLTQFPHARISEELCASFDVVAVPWTWRDADGSLGFEVFAPEYVCPTEEFCAMWQSGEFVTRHAIVRWFVATGDASPQSIARVLASIASPADVQAVADVLRPMGCDTQMAIPYRLAGIEHRAFILARTGRDFSDEDLEVGRLLQPAFRALDRQAQILAALPQPQGTARCTADLTGRELAVLSLLAEGYTAFSIARRLSSSPRTVQKHLEHIYRKLGWRTGSRRYASRTSRTCSQAVTCVR